MEYILAVFLSRTQTLEFIELMHGLGLQARTVSNPREAGIGCGISAAFRQCDLNKAKSLIASRRLNGFYGFFTVKYVGGGKRVSRLL